MTRRAPRPSHWLPILLLLLPGALLFGGRVQPLRDEVTDDPVERAAAAGATRLAERLALPEPVAPPLEFAPFGRPIAPRVLQGDEARGRLLTSLGHVDWDADRDD